MTTVTLNPTEDTCLATGSPTLNYGSARNFVRYYFATNKILMRFDLSGIGSGETISSATLDVFKGNSPDAARVRTHSLYQITDANGDWIEGTKDNTQALSGEPCWNAKEADGSGGVTTAWAGSAGMSTAGTDYVNTVLASTTMNRADAVYTKYTFTFNASGLAVLQSWFGDATNNGLMMMFEGSANYVAICSSESATEYRPVLSVTYTEGSTGVPKHFLHYARLRSN